MERDNGRGLNFSVAARCFSWPPPSSSYTCGYCKREFRSAQALGGHMNVHRRDRARLRQCCPAYAPNPNLIAAHRRAASPLPNLNFLAPPHTTAEPVVYSFFSTTTPATAMKAASVEVNLDLGMGGVCGRGGGAVEEGGLDLELRLGCPWE